MSICIISVISVPSLFNNKIRTQITLIKRIYTDFPIDGFRIFFIRVLATLHDFLSLSGMWLEFSKLRLLWVIIRSGLITDIDKTLDHPAGRTGYFQNKIVGSRRNTFMIGHHTIPIVFVILTFVNQLSRSRINIKL